jgi:hypothetical protein
MADALQKLEEALQRNTDAFSGHPGPAHATKEGEELFEEAKPAPPTQAAHTSVTPQEEEEMFPDTGALSPSHRLPMQVPDLLLH